MTHRLHYIDNLKGVLILLVVLGHCIQCTDLDFDHDSDRRCSFVGISYLCPEIVTRHERGDSFSFVLPFLIQKRTLKVCFFWLIVIFFENHSKKYQKKSIRVTEFTTELASTFFGWHLSKHKKTR